MGHYSFTIANGVRKGKIDTAHGTIDTPTFMPVTTFGDKYPLDKMVRPYLKRLSQCLMVSHFYAQEMKKNPGMPVFIDSGGFASLFDGSAIIEKEDFACIKTKDGDEIDPISVLRFQEKHADLGATLDFIIPPGMALDEAKRRQELTIRNALYAKEHVSADRFMLYGSLQSWNVESAGYCARIYSDAGFDGIAIGGMVPHAKDPEYIKEIVRAVRKAAPDCAIHVFGIGNPNVIPELIALGVDSFDSSSYVRSAVAMRDGKSRESVGIHTGLYAALDNLANINSVINKTDALISTIPNSMLCMH